MKTESKQVNIDELAAQVIQLGRLIAERAIDLSLGRGATDTIILTSCLERLAERQPFAEAVESDLDAVWQILLADLSAEIVEFEQRFVETHFDAGGQQGEVREVPVYSERGAELLNLQEVVSKFIDARHAVLDHVAAHRALFMLMGG